jgi:hypothetical protein
MGGVRVTAGAERSAIAGGRRFLLVYAGVINFGAPAFAPPKFCGPRADGRMVYEYFVSLHRQLLPEPNGGSVGADL